MKHEEKWLPRRNHWSGSEVEKNKWRPDVESSISEKKNSEGAVEKKLTASGTLKSIDPFCKPIPGKYFKCSQPELHSSDCPRCK